MVAVHHPVGAALEKAHVVKPATCLHDRFEQVEPIAVEGRGVFGRIIRVHVPDRERVADRQDFCRDGIGFGGQVDDKCLGGAGECHGAGLVHRGRQHRGGIGERVERHGCVDVLIDRSVPVLEVGVTGPEARVDEHLLVRDGQGGDFGANLVDHPVVHEPAYRVRRPVDPVVVVAGRGVESEFYIFFDVIGEFVIAVVVIDAHLRGIVSKKLEINFIMRVGSEELAGIEKECGYGPNLARGHQPHLERAVAEIFF